MMTYQHRFCLLHFGLVQLTIYGSAIGSFELLFQVKLMGR